MMPPPSAPAAPPRIAYRVHLHAGRERSLLRGHPWLYSGAVERIEALPDSLAGELGEILSADGEWLALATVHPRTTLVARVLGFRPEPIDQAWFADRFARAARLRADAIPPETDAYRLVHAEGDGLPGLIVDRYGSYLIVQCLSAGMARLAPWWLPALARSVGPLRGILAKAEAARRDPELEFADGTLWGEAPPESIVVMESGLRMTLRLAAGQKTGLYLDQRENRSLVGSLAAGRRVLDAFCYSGGFALHAAARGALSVTAVDTSAPALAQLEENWRLNGLEPGRLRVAREPVHRFLRHTRELYDLIVLDPPAFAKERGQVEGAARAYKDLNLRALARLAPQGYLATFSCSQHVGLGLFQKIVFSAALDAGRPVAWLRRLGAGPDHPVDLRHPQGEYLKGLLLRAGDAEGQGPAQSGEAEPAEREGRDESDAAGGDDGPRALES